MRAPSVGASELLGLLRLCADATVGIAGIAESLHGAILNSLGVPGRRRAGRTSGLTGFIYGTVRGVARLSGHAATGGARLARRLADRRAQAAATATGSVAPSMPATPAGTPLQEALLAVLNGVWGDHLESTGNPVAITAALRVGGRAVSTAAPDIAATASMAAGGADPLPPDLVVFIHGLCMNDRQWLHQGHDHSTMLADGGRRAVLHFHYNSGRAVHLNGRDLSAALESLVGRWPVPVRSLSLVGHSMGGLVARSACLAAAEAGQPWLSSLRRLVCLGTPHHGAPLERGGRLVDRALGLSRFAAPFARLGMSRSRGIQDLRFGHVQAIDGQPFGPGEAGADGRNGADRRRPAPLPAGVMTCLVAATRAVEELGSTPATNPLPSSSSPSPTPSSAPSSTPSSTPSRYADWMGDGLVPVASALGEHADPRLALSGIPEDRKRLVTGADHWDLLSHPAVAQALQAWFDDDAGSATPGSGPPVN